MFERKDDGKSGRSKRAAAQLACHGSEHTVMAGETAVSKKRRGPSIVDMSRSTNIAIGLASFKSRELGPRELAQAVDRLRTSVLSHDDLLRIQEMLPSEVECTAIKTMMHASSTAAAGGASKSRQQSASLSDSLYESLSDSEKWLFTLAGKSSSQDPVPSSHDPVSSSRIMIPRYRLTLRPHLILRIIISHTPYHHITYSVSSYRILRIIISHTPYHHITYSVS